MSKLWTPREFSYYPHMSKYEAALWSSVLPSLSSNYRGFRYDVRVGSGRSPLNGIGKKYENDWRDLTQRRIDAVGITPSNQAHIFEIKDTAGPGAIGQLLSYSELYTKTKNQAPERLFLVYREIDHETAELATTHGISLLQATPSEDYETPPTRGQARAEKTQPRAL